MFFFFDIARSFSLNHFFYAAGSIFGGFVINPNQRDQPLHTTAEVHLVKKRGLKKSTRRRHTPKVSTASDAQKLWGVGSRANTKAT